jgi:hypothetical protein
LPTRAGTVRDLNGNQAGKNRGGDNEENGVESIKVVPKAHYAGTTMQQHHRPFGKTNNNNSATSQTLGQTTTALHNNISHSSNNHFLPTLLNNHSPPPLTTTSVGTLLFKHPPNLMAQTFTII